MGKEQLFFANPENVGTFGQNLRKISCLKHLIWGSECFIDAPLRAKRSHILQGRNVQARQQRDREGWWLHR